MDKVIIIILIFSSIFAKAQTVVWSGLGDGISWEQGANWVGNNVPDQNNVVEIQADSVIAKDKVNIKQLKLLPGGILVHKSPNDGIFTIEESISEGVTIDGSAKLYVEGFMEVNNSFNNGILIEANGGLYIKPNGDLKIQNCNEDGIKGVVGGTFNNTKGNITLTGYGTDGIDVVSFFNEGKIFIYDNADTGLKISGSNGVNTGHIESYDGIIIQSTGIFTNANDGEIISHVSLGISSDFDNDGVISCMNTTGVSMELSGNKLFYNTNQIVFRNSTGTNLKITGSHEFLNGDKGKIIINNNTIPLTPAAYAVELIGVDSKLTNYGLVDIDIRGKKNGIWMDARSLIQNDSLFYISNYYEKGIITNNSGFILNAISNHGNAEFKITGGKIPTATSLILTQRNKLLNEACADFVMGDSVYLSGIAVNLTNHGYLQLPKFFKNGQAVFENDGAIFLSDSALATNIPSGYISQITNTGLIYHVHEGPIVTGAPVTSFFAALNTSNAEIIGNQIQILDNGLYANSGTVNTTTNIWVPPANAAGQDSVYFNYRKTGSSCDIRRLTMPFIIVTPDCVNTPAINVTFTGTISNYWNVAGNWSNNSLPRTCDIVTIPTGKTAIIATGQTVIIHKIYVEYGAVFETENGVVLAVEN